MTTSTNINSINIITTFIVGIFITSLFVFSPKTTIAQTGIQEIQNDDVIREISSDDVYIVKIVNGKRYKRLVLNEAIFESYSKYDWGDVLKVSQETLDEFVTSNFVIQVDENNNPVNGHIYRLEATEDDKGVKRHVRLNDQQIDRAGIDRDSIFYINFEEASPFYYKTEKPLFPSDFDLTSSERNTNIIIKTLIPRQDRGTGILYILDPEKNTSGTGRVVISSPPDDEEDDEPIAVETEEDSTQDQDDVLVDTEGDIPGDQECSEGLELVIVRGEESCQMIDVTEEDVSQDQEDNVGSSEEPIFQDQDGNCEPGYKPVTVGGKQDLCVIDEDYTPPEGEIFPDRDGDCEPGYKIKEIGGKKEVCVIDEDYTPPEGEIFPDRDGNCLPGYILVTISGKKEICEKDETKYIELVILDAIPANSKEDCSEGYEFIEIGGKTSQCVKYGDKDGKLIILDIKFAGKNGDCPPGYNGREKGGGIKAIRCIKYKVKAIDDTQQIQCPEGQVPSPFASGGCIKIEGQRDNQDIDEEAESEGMLDTDEQDDDQGDSQSYENIDDATLKIEDVTQSGIMSIAPGEKKTVMSLDIIPEKGDVELNGITATIRSLSDNILASNVIESVHVHVNDEEVFARNIRQFNTINIPFNTIRIDDYNNSIEPVVMQDGETYRFEFKIKARDIGDNFNLVGLGEWAFGLYHGSLESGVSIRYRELLGNNLKGDIKSGDSAAPESIFNIVLSPSNSDTQTAQVDTEDDEIRGDMLDTEEQEDDQSDSPITQAGDDNEDGAFLSINRINENETVNIAPGEQKIVMSINLRANNGNIEINEIATSIRSSSVSVSGRRVMESIFVHAGDEEVFARSLSNLFANTSSIIIQLNRQSGVDDYDNPIKPMVIPNGETRRIDFLIKAKEEGDFNLEGVGEWTFRLNQLSQNELAINYREVLDDGSKGSVKSVRSPELRSEFNIVQDSESNENTPIQDHEVYDNIDNASLTISDITPRGEVNIAPGEEKTVMHLDATARQGTVELYSMWAAINPALGQIDARNVVDSVHIYVNGEEVFSRGTTSLNAGNRMSIPFNSLRYYGNGETFEQIVIPSGETRRIEFKLKAREERDFNAAGVGGWIFGLNQFQQNRVISIKYRELLSDGEKGSVKSLTSEAPESRFNIVAEPVSVESSTPAAEQIEPITTVYSGDINPESVINTGVSIRNIFRNIRLGSNARGNVMYLSVGSDEKDIDVKRVRVELTPIGDDPINNEPWNIFRGIEVRGGPSISYPRHLTLELNNNSFQYVANGNKYVLDLNLGSLEIDEGVEKKIAVFISTYSGLRNVDKNGWQISIPRNGITYTDRGGVQEYTTGLGYSNIFSVRPSSITNTPNTSGIILVRKAEGFPSRVEIRPQESKDIIEGTINVRNQGLTINSLDVTFSNHARDMENMILSTFDTISLYIGDQLVEEKSISSSEIESFYTGSTDVRGFRFDNINIDVGEREVVTFRVAAQLKDELPVESIRNWAIHIQGRAISAFEDNGHVVYTSPGTDISSRLRVQDN